MEAFTRLPPSGGDFHPCRGDENAALNFLFQENSIWSGCILSSSLKSLCSMKIYHLKSKGHRTVENIRNFTF